MGVGGPDSYQQAMVDLDPEALGSDNMITAFDRMTTLRGTLFGSLAHGHAAPAAVKNAFYDVITAEFNGEFSSQEAVEELVNAVANAL